METVTRQSLRQRHLLLDLRNGLGRVEPLGTDSGTVHDGMTTIQTHRVVHLRFTFRFVLVARVGEPTERLQQDGRTQVLLRIPPIRRT